MVEGVNLPVKLRPRCILAGTLALLAAGAAAGPSDPVPSKPEDAPRIQVEELKRLLEKGEAVVVDVRGQEAWETGHAEGAFHIPLAELSGRLGELPKDKLIAAYCT